jgi:hypothetical protein
VPNTPQQQRRRDRVEVLLRVCAPFLDLLLGVGDRISRIGAPEGDDYHAIRPAGERLELGALRSSPRPPPARQPEA